MEWFDLVNRKNTLIRYESELVIRLVSFISTVVARHLWIFLLVLPRPKQREKCLINQTLFYVILQKCKNFLRFCFCIRQSVHITSFHAINPEIRILHCLRLFKNPTLLHVIQSSSRNQNVLLSFSCLNISLLSMPSSRDLEIRMLFYSVQ